MHRLIRGDESHCPLARGSIKARQSHIWTDKGLQVTYGLIKGFEPMNREKSINHNQIALIPWF